MKFSCSSEFFVLSGLFQVHQLQLVSPSPTRSTGFFFCFLARFKYMSIFSFSFIFTLWTFGTAKSTIRRILFLFFCFCCCCLFYYIYFFLLISLAVLLARITRSVCISKSQRILFVWFSRTDAIFCLFHLVVWSNFNFLPNFLWITFPTQTYLVLYSFYTSLINSLVILLIVSSLSPHNLQLLFCCVLSYLPTPPLGQDMTQGQFLSGV